MTDDLFIKQLLLGDLENLSYIIGDKRTGDVFVIDPAGSWKDILCALKEDKLSLKAVFLTHGHYDHVVGVDNLDVPVYLSKKEAFFYTPQARKMIRVANGDKFPIGRFTLECMDTPGHTPGCMSFLVEGNLFTGDTLFIDAVGRTDFPGGNSGVMFESLRSIKQLPSATEIWPGHNYGQLNHASLAHVMQHNPFLACDVKTKFENFFA